MQDRRKREIRIVADSFRDICNVSRYGILDLFKECERSGYKLIRYPLGHDADLGFSLKKDNDVIIFTNSCSRLSREIFTLAHEIGHVMLHFNDEPSFVDNNHSISGYDSNENEQEANYFAACLLMPEEVINRFIDLELPEFQNNGLSAMDIARIMSEFNVSYDMVLNRLESIGKIDMNKKLLLDSERTQLRVGNLLRSIGGNAKLNVATNEISIPHEYIDYIIYNYNHNAIPQETLEKALDYYQLTLEDISDRLVEHNEINDRTY